ncbi:MAG: hypothetical protein IJ593_11000 [Lachnospiraceae bacterium]|nr:hypothetical protein [Lachnospiraceae bacterium]
MKLCDFKNIGVEFKSLKYIPDANLVEYTPNSIVRQFAKLGKDDEVLELLKIFNENIVEFNSNEQTYTVRLNNVDRILPLNSLSTGERLFVLCKIADETKNKIVIQNDITQLDNDRINDFFRIWGKSEYVNVSIINSSYKPKYTKLLERYGK